MIKDEVRGMKDEARSARIKNNAAFSIAHAPLAQVIYYLVKSYKLRVKSCRLLTFYYWMPHQVRHDRTFYLIL